MSEHDNLQEADGKKDEIQSQTETKTSEVNKKTNETEGAIENSFEESLETETTPEKTTPEVENKDEDAINEIDESNAEDAEDEGNADRHHIEEKEYDKMSLEELANELDKLVTKEKVQAIKSHVESIRSEFKSKFNSLLEEKKEEFLNDGGNEIDFYYSSPIQKRFKETYKEYRNKLNAYYKNIEKSLKDNLTERLEIIEEIKSLINVEENINTTYKHFKELQERWKNAGPIPRDKYNNAWNSYHHHVEIFYDFLHLNRDLRDLDFKHNLEQKLKIIERAEELAKDDNLNRAFRELQVLHKMWKEELGPVGKEHREEIWERFKSATKTIHDRRQVYFAELDTIYEKNLEVKQDLISQIQAIAEKGADSHNAWQNAIKQVEELRNEFFSAGKVPIKVNEATWAEFKEAVRQFNRNKNAFYKNLKKAQYDNLQKKLDLIKVAEDNKDSEDFQTTTPLMKRIQSDWKKIGHVPRKNSDKIWKQFKTACNHYFDRLHAAKDAANVEGNEAYAEKVKLLDTLKNLELTGKKEDDLAAIKVIINSWKEVGNVPGNKRYIEGKLHKTLDGVFKKLKLNPNEGEMIKFETKLENLSNAEDSRHLDNERQFIRKKINEVKAEINQLENNLQFFQNVNDDNPLVQEVHKNIEKHKQDLNLWKTKLNKIKSFS
ncbi:DUF349 domain-containing protein [Hanstruepera marina]|uniref:DUF349 domain-containing protein n=1 Tax=Hanstruepera marina TaxID=2873265 RepID=UPI001CA74AB6|nr:DUF349 domain-containing protein [Hanstruepera marina]